MFGGHTYCELEGVQRRATKYILNDFTSDYKERLQALGLLPLMYILEMNDIMLCVKSLTSPTRDFNILEFVHFSKGGTRSSTAKRMSHNQSTNNSARHFFFNRLPRLWNSLPPLDLELSLPTIKQHLHNFLYSHFQANFVSHSTCSFHFLCPCAKCIHKSHPPHF